jgi:LPXTG-motif cell wall-anchored protein
VDVDANGNVLVTGRFTGTVDFDPGTGTTARTSAGSGDIYVAKFNVDGDLLWVQTMGSTGNEQGNSVISDSSGNVFVAGRFVGTVDFDPSTGTTNLTDSANAGFVMKLSAGGNFVWAALLTRGSSEARADGVGVDATGNVYVTGYFSGTADFDPGSGTTNLAATGPTAGFVVRLGSDGALSWAKQIGGSGGLYGNNIVVTSSGISEVVGTFAGTADFDPGAGTVNRTTNGGDDVYVLRLAANGDFVWVATVGGAGNDYAPAITLEANDHTYVGGFFLQTADFDPGAGSLTITAAGASDAFVMKLDNTGGLVWAKAFGGTNAEITRALSVDSSGNIAAAGNFAGAVDFDPDGGVTQLTSSGSNDAFIAKLASTGTLSWARQVGGTGDDQAFAIKPNATGEIFLVGIFSGTVDFNPESGTTNVAALGTSDAFFLKLTPLGAAASATTTTTTTTSTTTTSSVAPSTTASTATTNVSAVSVTTTATSVRVTGTTQSSTEVGVIPATGSSNAMSVAVGGLMLLCGVVLIARRRVTQR